MTSPTRQHRLGSPTGFSLVEIVLAIGITSFALIATMGLLPIGLSTLRESTIQTATANISQQLRGDLQQISFNTNATFNIQDLASTNYYFTREGVKTDTTTNPYYKATFALSGGMVGGTTFDGASAQSIKVTLTYPYGTPDADQRTVIFSLFAARQSEQ